MRSNLDFSQFRILIVDDVPLNRVLVEKMLGNFNFNVHQCENGLECMKEFYYHEDIVKAFNLGADDFITKPIVMDKLLNTVAKHLGLPLDNVSK